MDYYKKLCKNFHPDTKKEIHEKRLANSLMKVINKIKTSNNTDEYKNNLYKNLYYRLIV